MNLLKFKNLFRLLIVDSGFNWTGKANWGRPAAAPLNPHIQSFSKDITLKSIYINLYFFQFVNLCS